MKNFMSPTQIAKICQVAPSSVIRWIHEGKLNAFSTAGGHHRIQRKDILPFLKSLRMPIPEEFLDQKTILIVDDEGKIRKLIKQVIEKSFEGVHVEEAKEGFVAGWLSRSLLPELVILDINLPGMDGVKVCRLIRSFPELKNTRILAVSGVLKSKRDEILSCGANDFLAKPFMLAELRKKISEQLRNTVLEEK